MHPLTLQEIAQATAAEIRGNSGSAPVIATVSDDSRKVKVGSLFIALRGERFDAHDFLPQVARDGAAAILADREDKIRGLAIPVLLVGNTRKALGQLAHHVRQKLKCRVIAIGGSNGKTTTKHLVGSVLAAQFKGTQSPKSFNNDIGVPLTLLGADPGGHYIVLELGTNHPGELTPLSLMSEPQIAVVTSIGAEHLEGFGDLDGVRREEACLLDGLRPDGLVIANGDDAAFLDLIRRRAGRLMTLGFGPGNDTAVASVQCSLDGIRFRVSGSATEFHLPLPGRHNAANALAAIAIGREFGMTDSAICDALASCSRPEMRMQLLRINGMTILNDAYNANPASMQAALQALAEAEVPGRRLAILGEMRELGTASRGLHEELGRMAANSGLAGLVCVGGHAKALADAAIVGGMAADAVHFVTDAETAARMSLQLVQSGDTVLLKGSRGVKLELVANALMGISAAGNKP
jgi:UDP-N-acetylmuramoyl-tripeptide--D-alanyl-D-alanine ligase